MTNPCLESVVCSPCFEIEVLWSMNLPRVSFQATKNVFDPLFWSEESHRRELRRRRREPPRNRIKPTKQIKHEIRTRSSLIKDMHERRTQEQMITFRFESRRREIETRHRRGEGERRVLVEERERDEVSVEVRERDAESSSDQRLIPLDSVEKRVRYDEYTDSAADWFRRRENTAWFRRLDAREREHEREKRSRRWMTKRKVWFRLGREMPSMRDTC